MTTSLRKEPSPDSVAANILQKAEHALDRAGQISDLVQGGLHMSEAILKIGSAVPLLGPVCNIAREILADVRNCADKADDVIEAGRRVYDMLKTIEVMARNLDRLGHEECADLKELMADVYSALIDMRELVQSFAQRGWFKRLLQLSKHEITFRKLD
eukprot:5658435-Prymnesium_polylepis.1